MITVLTGVACLFVLLFVGVPIGFGMAIIGFLGFFLIVGWEPALAMLGQITFETPMSYSLTVIPLFILMGNFIVYSRLAGDLYTAAYSFLGHRKGGLALATIAACAGFSSVSGSSLATVATVSKVAMPEMRRYHYSDSLAAGSVAAGGTLGILIPPSVALVLYGIITNNDIGKLFIAGILPGLLGFTLYMAAAYLVTRCRPEAGPQGPRMVWRDRFRALAGVWGIALLFIVVIGGIYFGLFTPTEAASIGASGAFLFALLRSSLTFRALIDVLIDSAQMSSKVFIILIGAILFSNFVNVAGFSSAVSRWIAHLHANPYFILIVIMMIYIVLGAFIESMSMMLLTLPIFYPIALNLGFDPIWFGILVVVVVEISLITPPLGLNVFVLRASLPDVPVTTIFRGVAPFVVADIVRLALLIAFPWIALVLPRLM